MAKHTADSTGDTQAARRLKFGLNVAIAMVAAVGIVVFINIISFKFLERARFDTTHARRYSLSDQTRKLLRDVKHDYRIVTLVTQSNTHFETAKELIEEYGYYSGKVTVTHLDPASGRGAEFFKTVTSRYENQLDPIRTAIDHGRQALQEAESQILRQSEAVQEATKDRSVTNPKHTQLLESLARFFQQFQRECRDIGNSIEEVLDQPLADMSRIIGALTDTLSKLEGVLAEARSRFRVLIDEGDTPDSLKNKLLLLSDSFEQMGGTLAEPLRALRDAPDASGYNELRNELAQPNSVVLIGHDEVQVIALQDMFRESDPDEMARAQAEGRPGERPFMGEEKITGALVSMELEHKPLVVFVTDDPRRPALGRGGTFGRVADRLQSMNFDVREWNPVGRQQMGRPPIPRPPPKPDAGQKAVWVVSALSGPNPMMGMQGPDNRGKIAQLVGEQLDSGHAALIMFAPDPGASFGVTNPLVKLVETWAITPQVDRLVHREELLQGNQTVGVAQHQVADWPDASPITQAIGRIRGLFAAACPLVLGSTQGKGIEHRVLAEVKGDRLWAETNLQGGSTPRFDEAKAKKVFTIAASAQKEHSKLIVVADPIWATDQVTGYGRLGQNTADIFGAIFPANAELFVNSVFWLADLDQLIARSARAQDIRRIGDISEGGLVTVWVVLLAGMPLVTIATGVGVWLVRRSG